MDNMNNLTSINLFELVVSILDSSIEFTYEPGPIERAQEEGIELEFGGMKY